MTIYEQLGAYCNCSEMDDKDVDEAIHIVSQMTCWNSEQPNNTDEFCNTFLSGDRQEIIDLPNCIKKCPAFYFYPFYHPFDPNSFTFKIARISGITEEIFDVTDVSYVYTKGAWGIDLSEIIPSCQCANKCQVCKDEYKLIVTYTAGYEEIPDCMLPVLCNLVNVIHAKNDCDCIECVSCSNGQTTVNPMTGQVQTSVQTIKYASGDLATVQLETELARLVVDNYKAQLSLISLCSSYKTLWGAVV